MRLSIPHIIGSLALLVTSFFVIELANHQWSLLVSAVRPVIGCFILACILAILRPSFQGRLRTATGLALGAALLIGATLALSEPYHLAQQVIVTFIEWNKVGAGICRSWQEAASGIRYLSLDDQSRLIAKLMLGMPMPLGIVMLILAKLLPDPNNRVSRSGPWQAKWMGMTDIMTLRHNAEGLPLGFHKGALLRYQSKPSQGWRGGHHAAIAGTRAGKGVSVVIPAILDHDGPVVALDIKGENFAVTRRHRMSLGRDVIVLNPFGVVEPSKDRFNPLDYIRAESLVRDIDVIAEGLVRSETGNGSHFAEMARTVIAATIEVVMTQYPKDKQDLTTVMDILFASNFDQTIKAWAEDTDTYGRRVAAAASTFIATGENEGGAIKTTIKRSFDWARSDEMQTFLSSSNCNLDDVFYDLADAFIVVPLDQVDTQSVFLRLFTNIILGMAVRQSTDRKMKRTMLLVLDEFVRLGRMEKLVNIANVAAGAGIEALFITQDKGQIESVYGKGDTASILGSCVTIRVFGLGRGEYDTANWVANALGDQTIITQTTQRAQKLGDRDKQSKSEQRQKLMTTDQVLEMKQDQMLLLTGSKPPLIINSIISHKHHSYHGKLDRNPTL